MIEKVKEGIEVSKKYLDTLPKNNIKNVEKFKTILEETKISYRNIFQKVEMQINDRFNKFCDIKDDQASGEQLEKIEFIRDRIFLLNKFNGPYQKFEFDKILYQLGHFYKSDLNEANKNILECVKVFERVGINLTYEDFDYNEYTQEYMKVLLDESNTAEKIKEVFEKIYWQCPNLLIHIELNIKFLYHESKNAFVKYENEERKKFLKFFTKDPLSYYKNLVISYDNINSSSLKSGLNKFLSKEWNINDFQDIKIEKYYTFFTAEVPNQEINEEINKLSNSALEYKNYLSFKYIIDDIKQKYLEKRNTKTELQKLRKIIQKDEKLIDRYNRKKRKNERINTKTLALINELETLYEKLDETLFYDRVSRFLNDNSTIYEALCLACSHYSYMVDCMKTHGIDRNFNEEQQRLEDFILSPYNTLIMNIAISEEVDLALIISDRYKLSNFNVSKENFASVNEIDEIINNANKIDIYNKVVSKLSYDNLKFLEKASEICEK